MTCCSLLIRSSLRLATAVAAGGPRRRPIRPQGGLVMDGSELRLHAVQIVLVLAGAVFLLGAGVADLPGDFAADHLFLVADQIVVALDLDHRGGAAGRGRSSGGRRRGGGVG